MKYLLILVVLLFIAGCTTTAIPNTERQEIAADRHKALLAHKTWCAANHGVFVDDDIKPSKCYRTEDFNAAVRRAYMIMESTVPNNPSGY